MLRHNNFGAHEKSSPTNVTISIEQLNPIGQLNGTLGSVSAAELASEVITGLINDIDPSVFGDVIIGQSSREVPDKSGKLNINESSIAASNSSSNA